MAAAPMPIEPTNRELEYRAKNYQDLKSIERKQIACATCGTNLSAKLERPGGVFIHPFMNTLQCKKCSDFYGDGDFSMDEDGEDKYCRMCGKGGTLFICGNKPCPYGFCQVCVDRYIGKNSSEVEADDWKCLHCNCKPLWEVRAVCAVIVLEKSKKRSKHRKKSTRGEVYDSDDDCSHSQDSNGDFENSKQLRRRPLRSVRNSKVKNKVLETLERICDNSNDSPPCSNPPSKSIAGKRDSNSKIRHIDSGANQSSVAKTKITETSRRGKELKKQIASSEDEATDLEETDIIRKKLTQSKTHKAFAEFESKSMKQQSNRNLSRSLMQQQKTSRLSQKYPEPSQSVQSSKDPRSDSDFESSNGSANEFVKSKKKKTSKTLTEKSSKTDSATQQKKSIASKSVNSKVDLKRSKNKFGNVVRGKESRESSLEPKHTNRKRNNHFVQNSSINTLRKKSMPSKMHTSESEEETDGPNKNCALGASRERTQSTDSENEKSEEDENPKSYSQVSTSSTVDKESRKAPKTMRLSIKPLRRISQVSQTPSLREYGDEFLDRKKSSIKSSHKKIAFTKDCVTMDEGRIIKDHIDKLLSEIKIFGKSVCAGANGIAAKNLTNNATSVPIVSKTVLKCALLMIRCKKSLNIIENEFVKSYENWCQSSKVESIFLDVENSDVATSNEVEPIEKGETSVNTNKKDGIRQDYKRKRSADNSDEFSDASNDYQNCEVTGSMLATENSHSDAEQKSVDENEDSNDSRSTEKIVHDVEKPANADSDGDSRNSVHDALSDCDREIFSEDECRGQDQKSPKPTTERISSPIESVPSNIPKNRSIASDSDERETLEPENSKNIEEKSSESDNMVEKPIDEAEDHREDNQEKVTEEYTEQSSRVESSIEDSYQPDLALENILENTVASDNGTTLHLNGKSKHSDDDDRTSANCSEITDQLSVTEQSAVPDVEETRYSPSDVEMVTDDDDTMDLWKTSLAKKKKSSQTSQQNKKRKISNPDSLSNAITHEDYLSDCDTIIFTQIQSEDSTSGSNAYHIAKSTDLVENSAETEDVSVSGLEIGNDAEKTSEKNDNSKDDVVSLPKEVTPSPEMIAEQHEEADDLDTEQNSKDVSNELETSEKTRDRGNVIENHSTAPSSDNRENNAKEGIDAVEEDGIEEEFEEKQPTAVDEDSEEAIKKKILESDSEWSDESAARSDSFVLKVNSDSEEYRKELILKDTAKTIVALDEPIARQKLTNSIIKSVKCPKSSKSSGPVDTYISDLNNLAKRRLLSSSSSSSSDADDIPLKLPENLNKFDSHSTSSLEENNEATQSSDTTEESTILSSSKTKKKKFNLEHNYYFKTDKKLQSCQVVVRRLNDAVLGQFSQSLAESMKRQELEDFRSLVDLNNIKKRKRGTIESNQSGSSSESSSSKGHVKKTRSKLVQEKEETLLDHLEKMNNGENYCNLSGDDTDENNDILKQIMPEGTDQDDFLKEANKLAKDLLIQSSDSENEMQPLTENAEEREQEEEPEAETEKEKQQEQSNLSEETVDSESNAENGSNTEKDNEETANVEEKVDSNENEDSDSDRTKERKKMKDGLAKRHWRLTDSDSSDEEKKWNKSQLKESDEKKTPKKEERSKNKKKVKRRVLGSDSDSTKVPDDSDDDSVEMIELKNSSSADTDDSTELFSSLRKKTRPKRNAARKTDSSSDSEQNEKPTKQRRKRIKKMESDSDSDNLTNSQDTSGKLHRKNIRKVLKDKQVADVTKMAGKEEEDRLRRIADRQKLYNEMYEIKLRNEAKVDNLILDFDEETKKVLVSVHEGLVKRLKPHQAQGIKFMWDACFESLERTKSTKGSGCIVAHCMGLGKTFQVVTLAHTLLTHPETGIKTIMVICPLSTVLNWVNEFKKWLGDINNDEDVEVFEMTKMKKNFERKYQLEKWHRAGGVMILGYEMFRLLSNQTGKKMRKSLHEGILKCLVDPGPDLIVCDEGHLLKNEDTALSKAMRRVKTLRRIVLTGTPLQNNLVEYHCMVQFVKPNLLGTKKEFLNRFVNPITNGQFDDSTEYDVKLMKKRAHVLHKMLEGSVQRFDYSVLTPFLPPKQEYVITVRLADIQITLYQHYLDHYSRKKVGAGTSLFADFQALQRIWTHPIVLRMNAEKMEKINEKKRLDASDSEGSLRDFLDDGSEDKTTSSDDSDVLSANSSSDEKTEKPEKPRRGTRANPIDPATIKQEEEELPQSGEWWSQFVEPEHFEDLRISSKLVLLFAILKESEQIGDKVLVFSQSLYALSLIEEFLNKIDDETQKGTCSELLDNHTGSWSLGLDYFRLDGQTPPENRSHYCKIFNNPKNSRARLFLISTRAGGLGINLTAANRVIIFDASWNPSHDVQSIFRIYRFGQKKPCYVYRFLAQGTMEEKIYNRQVTKLSLSCRVVDEQQIERHYSNHDLAELYQFEPNTSTEKPTLNLPKDRLLAEILRKYDDRIETLHEHDSLLENKAEEELDEEERKEAWKEYEDERTGRKVLFNNFTNQNLAIQQYNDMMNMNQADIANRATLSGINIETLQALIRKDYPNTTPEQQKMMTQRAIMDMYTYMENEAIRQQQLAAVAAANSFTYPTVSNLGTSSFVDGNNAQTAAQRQYALQQQQQQHQIRVQREQQANYAKRFGNVRGPGLSATATRPPQIINLQDDNDVIEVPTTPPPTAGPTPSSSVQTPSVSTPAVAENSKRQEE